MAKKTYLIARREFIENIRTKAFWIGILMFPVIWVVALTVPALFKKAKSVRNYAVLDQSKDGWFMRAFEQRTRIPDLGRLFDRWQKADHAGRAELPQALSEARWQRVMSSDSDRRRQALDQIRVLYEMLDTAGVEFNPERLDGFRDQIPIPIADEQFAAAKAVVQDLNDFKAWWQERAESKDKEVRQSVADLVGDAGLGKYQRVEASDEEWLKADLASGDLFAYFVVPSDPVGKAPEPDKPRPVKTPDPGKGDGKGEVGRDDGGKEVEAPDPNGFKYVTKKENLADRDLKDWFTRHGNRIVRKRRIESIHLDSGRASWISQGISFSEKRLGEGGKEEEVERADQVLQYAPIVFVYLLWICVFTMANILLTNTIEEKSNKVIEVLLSSVSPLQLMRGKILGLAAMGLTMVACWAVFAWLGIKLVPMFIDGSASVIAEFGIDKILTNPRYLVSFLIYFLGGYLLYASMLVGIGAVCNSLKEAQNLMQPVVLILIIPLLAMFPIVQDPNGTLAKVLTYVPVFTPFVMMNRAAGPPTMLEYLISTILMIATIWFAMWLAAKIFRIGILMTGKRPKIREIIGWMRAPVGSIPVRAADGETS